MSDLPSPGKKTATSEAARTKKGNFARVRASASTRIVSLALAGGLSILLGACAVAPPSSPWPASGYNAAQSRANLKEATLTVSTVRNATFRRKVIAPSPLACSEGVAGPILTGGQMIAVMAGVVTDYNAATGRVRWKTRQFPDTYLSIAVTNGVVLVSSLECGSASDPGGSIQAFSLATGATLWSAFAPAGGFLVVSGPYAIEYGASAGSGLTITAYLATTGAIAWQKSEDACGGANVIVVAGRVVRGACDSNNVASVEADELTTGRPVWRHDASWSLQRGDNDAVATGNHVYMTTSGGTVIDVNPKNGARKFSLRGATNVGVVDSTRVYAECGIRMVCGYDIAAGRMLWKMSGAPPVAEAGEALYLRDGTIINASNGRRITKLVAGQGPRAVGDGRIAIVTDSRTIQLFGLPGS